MPLPPNPWLSNGSERISFVAFSPDAGRRLDQFLVTKLSWRSRTGIQKLLSEGHVFVIWPDAPEVEEKADKPSLKLRVGAKIIIETPVPRIPPPANLKELESNIDIIYEDEWIVAINKPPFMASHPAGRYLYGTVISILFQRYKNADPEKDIIPHLCHRLDRETSGAIVSSKSDDVRHLLGRQFEEREVRKEYLAIVEGEMEEDEMTVDMPIDTDTHSPIRLKMATVKMGGQHALTRFKVIERVPGFTLVLCKPLTGRQHQIRVHLSSIGHPIAGDKLYGPSEQFFLDYISGELSEDAKKRLILGRQALHAFTITFTHPIHQKDITISAPLARDMHDFLAKARAGQLDTLVWNAPDEPRRAEPWIP